MRSKKVLACVVALVVAVVVALLLGGVVGHFLLVRSLYTEKVTHDPALAMTWIRGSHRLRPLYDEFGIDLAQCRIVEAHAAKGLLQCGPRFYLVCEYGPDAATTVRKRLLARQHREGTWRSYLSDDITGAKCVFVESGADGPETYAVIDAGNTCIVHYVAYGGDG